MDPTRAECTGGKDCTVEDEVRTARRQHLVLAAGRLTLADVHHDDGTATSSGAQLRCEGEGCATTPAKVRGFSRQGQLFHRHPGRGGVAVAMPGEAGAVREVGQEARTLSDRRLHARTAFHTDPPIRTASASPTATPQPAVIMTDQVASLSVPIPIP